MWHGVKLVNATKLKKKQRCACLILSSFCRVFSRLSVQITFMDCNIIFLFLKQSFFFYTTKRTLFDNCSITSLQKIVFPFQQIGCRSQSEPQQFGADHQQGHQLAQTAAREVTQLCNEYIWTKRAKGGGGGGATFDKSNNLLSSKTF